MIEYIAAHCYWSLWSASSREDKVAGRQWYPEAFAECTVLSSESSYSIAQCAGVLAALSPRLRWSANLVAARAMVLDGTVLSGLLGRSVLNAKKILAEDFSGVSGSKVCAFFAAILGDPRAIVLDTWMLKPLGLETVTPKQYRTIARGLARAARRARVSNRDFQATVWVYLRGAKD